jgi:septal ring-binding cell division protein DamX
VKGEASFSLDDPTPRETRVDVKVDYAIAGSLAQFSRGGIVKELATRMTEAFAANLKARLDLSASQVAATTTAPVAEPELATVSAPDSVTTPAATDPPVVQPTDVISAHTANPATQPSANAPLNLGNMFWKILWSRVCGLFGFGVRR